ncbi:MAG: hypothetical protein HY763_03290 [Planctomycetes bacterium]|nr:hypothetical protein [Planctomycetota bacterium]
MALEATRTVNAQLPSFRHPPVVETVLGVQFARIDGFTNAHLGAFWKYLVNELEGGPRDWLRTSDAPPLPDTFETFGASDKWTAALAASVAQSDAPRRLQIRNATNDRMIQVQSTRLHYNWVGTAGDTYPRYTRIRPEFDRVLSSFGAYLRGESLGELRANQWEVTYVNHIPKGSVWDNPGDWSGLFPTLPGPAASISTASFESFGGQWHYEICPKLGRLHVDIRHGRRNTVKQEELLVMTLTARGPVDESVPLNRGLELGHETIVRSFAELTAPEAHAVWEINHA